MDSSRYLDGWSRSRSPGAPTRSIRDTGLDELTVAGQRRICTDFPWTSNACIQLYPNPTTAPVLVSKGGENPAWLKDGLLRVQAHLVRHRPVF